jgi:hypothetical protein
MHKKGHFLDIMFWPSKAKHIADYIALCAVCQRHQYSNTKEPLTSNAIQERSWQNVAADIFSLDNRDYLVTADYYRRYFEVDSLPNTQSITVIRKLKVHFARCGICDKLVTNNRSQISSENFCNFAKEWGFSHETSSPLHPISNGLAEKTVSFVKRIFKKAQESRRDLYLATLEYRNTPLECGFSPNQLLMGSRTQSILLTTNSLLKPKTVSPEFVKEKMQKIKEKQKSNYDKSVRKLPPVKLNESVRIQVNKLLEPAKFVKVHNDRSYSVQTPAGGVYRRNRCMLNKTMEKVKKIQEFSPEVLDQNIPLPIPNERKMSTSNNDDRSITSDRPSPNDLEIPYQTRSGREVRKNKRFFDENWINK